MMNFITNESAQLKAFIRWTLHSKLLRFKYLSITDKISLNHKNYDMNIKISEIKSIENFTIVLYINEIIVGKFRTCGILTSEAINGLYKIIILTRRGKIFLEFGNGAN